MCLYYITIYCCKKSLPLGHISTESRFVARNFQWGMNEGMGLSQIQELKYTTVLFIQYGNYR